MYKINIVGSLLLFEIREDAGIYIRHNYGVETYNKSKIRCFTIYFLNQAVFL